MAGIILLIIGLITFLPRPLVNMTAFKRGEKNPGHTILLSRDHLNSVHALRLACHDVEPPLQHFEHSLHPWVAFAVLPLFAFANAGLSFKGMNLTVQEAFMLIIQD